MFNSKFRTGVELFGVAHIVMLAILTAIAVGVVLCRGFFKRSRTADKVFRYGVVSFMVAIELTYWVWALFFEKLGVLEILPCELCAISLWTTAVAVVFDIKKLQKITFFWGLTGPLLSLLVVQVDYMAPHFRFFHYFLVHFSILLLNVYCFATARYKLTWKSPMIASGILLAVSIVPFAANYILGTNFMFLMSLPSELDAVMQVLGRWGYLPIFILFIFASFQLWYWLTVLIGLIKSKLFKTSESVAKTI